MPASWFSPVLNTEIIGPSADTAVTQGTLAWSYRWTAGELDSPTTPRLFTSDQFSFIEIAGGNDSTGRGIGSQLVNSSWSNIVSMSDQGGYTSWLMPGTTHNFVLIWDAAGTLSGGMTCQLWHNGNLVRGSTSALSNVGMQGTVMFGDYGGANVNPGETQGWWYSNDTAMAPATLFSDLFDGANGLRDLAAPVTISGTTPDVVYISPGAGVSGTASGSTGATGTATGTVSIAGISGAASGSANSTGASSGSVRVAGVASGSANTSGASQSTVRIAGASSGASGVSGTSTGVVRIAGAASPSTNVTGTATGTVGGTVISGMASGAAVTSGVSSGSTAAEITGGASGAADTTGTASGYVFTPAPRTVVVVSSRTSRRGTPYDFTVAVEIV